MNLPDIAAPWVAERFYTMDEKVRTTEYYTPEMLETMKQVFRTEIEPGNKDGLYPEREAYQCVTHIASTVNRRTREEVIVGCVKILKNLDYDTFAFQGASGIGISLILAHMLQKEVILVRKDGEPRQAWAQYCQEGYRYARRYVVVDDLISTGTTVGRVIRGVRELAPNAELAGILLYWSGPSLITAADKDPRWNWVQEKST